MAEKNIFNKELGEHQTQEEWDAYRRKKAQRTFDFWEKEAVNRVNNYNKFGSDTINYETYRFNPDEFDLATQYYRLGNDFNKHKIAREVFGDDEESAKIFRRELEAFEMGDAGWADLSDITRDWYISQGFDPTGYDERHGFTNDWNERDRAKAQRTFDFWEKEAVNRVNNYNKFGSAIDFETYRMNPNAHGFETQYYRLADDYNPYSISRELHGDDHEAAARFRKELEAFEKGEAGWKALSQSTQQWYLSKFDPEDIVAEVDDATGKVITVADLMPETTVSDTPTVDADEAPGAPVTTTIDYNNPAADTTVPSSLNIPKYNYNTYGVANINPNSLNTYNPYDVSGLLEQFKTPADPTGDGEWVYNPLTGQWDWVPADGSTEEATDTVIEPDISEHHETTDTATDVITESVTNPDTYTLTNLTDAEAKELANKYFDMPSLWVNGVFTPPPGMEEFFNTVGIPSTLFTNAEDAGKDDAEVLDTVEKYLAPVLDTNSNITIPPGMEKYFQMLGLFQKNDGGKVPSYNNGGNVRNYNTGDLVLDKFAKSDFSSEGINPALTSALWNTANWYQTDDQGGVPAWYGTQFDAEGNLESINAQGQTLDEWMAAGGNPNKFQALSPVAGFNETQKLGQQALINASQGQGQLAKQLADVAQLGLGGQEGISSYVFNPQTAATIADVQGYDAAQIDPNSINRTDVAHINPALRDQSNYLNQYLNPAVQQAQQQAIANVNSSFGQGGTLGGARNVRSAATGATQAGLPILTQGANTQFQADQAIDAANQQFFNQAEAANAAAANQASSQNQQAQLQAALANAGAQNQAQQFGATAQNQANQLNQAALNQADAANAAAANQASQFNLGNRLAWAGQFPTVTQSLSDQGFLLNQVGQQQQDLAQQQANQDVAAWNYNQTIPQQQLFNQIGLAQLAQAGQNANIGYNVGDTSSGGGFDLGSTLTNSILGGITGGDGLGGITDLLGGLGGLFSNSGGMVPNYNSGGLLDDTMDTTGIIPVGRRNVTTRRA